MSASIAAPDVSVVRGDASAAIDWGEAQLCALFERPSVRVTIHASAAVVLGCAQRPSESDRLRALAAGTGLCVRTSGGGAVLAGPWMLGLGVALPADDPRAAMPIAASYKWLGTALADWLIGMRIPATATAARAATDGRAAWACFAQPSCWEPCVAGRKIAGLAQIRRRNGVLYTAGVLLARPPWPLLCAVLGRPSEDAEVLATRVTSCAQMLGHAVDADAAAASLADALWRVLAA